MVSGKLVPRGVKICVFQVFIDLGNNGLFWSMMFLVLGVSNFLVFFVQVGIDIKNG